VPIGAALDERIPSGIGEVVVNVQGHAAIIKRKT